MKLNIGCGKDNMPHFINIDKIDYGDNLVFNIEKKVWSFPNESVDEIIASKILEHIIDVEFVLQECYRVLKKGGKIRIIVPYFKNPVYYQPLHKSFFNWSAFDEFCWKKNILETKTNFELVERSLIFEKQDFFGLMPFIAKKNYFIYERWFSHFFPARYLYFELVKK